MAIHLTPATDPNQLAANLLTTGEEVFPRDWAISSGAITMTSQLLRLTYFTARKTETTVQVRVSSGNTAAGATPTLCRLGLYAIDAAGDGTLVASTANDTALFAGTTTSYTKSWSSPYAKVAGVRYAVGFLVVTGATAPTLAGNSLASAAEAGVSPRTSATIAAQADLPASFTAASLTNSALRAYAAVLP